LDVGRKFVQGDSNIDYLHCLFNMMSFLFVNYDKTKTNKKIKQY